MGLREWFKRFNTAIDSTESITNETFAYMGSCGELSDDDKKFLNSLDYNDGEIEQIEEIMAEED